MNAYEYIREKRASLSTCLVESIENTIDDTNTENFNRFNDGLTKGSGASAAKGVLGMAGGAYMKGITSLTKTITSRIDRKTIHSTAESFREIENIDNLMEDLFSIRLLKNEKLPASLIESKQHLRERVSKLINGQVSLLG